MKRYLMVLVLLAIASLVTVPVLAQGPGGGKGIKGQGFGPGHGEGSIEEFGGGYGIVNRLNRALQNAGAMELTDEQIADLEALVTEAQENRPEPDGEIPTGVTLHQEYGNAILEGNTGLIQSIANEIALLTAEKTAEHLVRQAEFQIGILNILDYDNQTAVIIEEEGTRGLLRLLSPVGSGRGNPMGNRMEGRMGHRPGSRDEIPEN